MWTTDTEEKARAIIQDFTSRGLKLATAESCTG
ncbi:damage-inducible protein CinA, partial [Sinorhizobium meliloti]